MCQNGQRDRRKKGILRIEQAMVCIYCLKDLPKEFYISSEHVIPQAFGKFGPDTPTLIDLVCDECNNYFGRTIDLILARRSLEALDRFRYGIKPADEINDLQQGRVQFSFGQEGEWQGIIFELKADKRDANGIVVEPIPQVGFAKKSGKGHIYIPEEVLKNSDYALPDGIDLKKELLIIADTDQTMTRIIKTLKLRNINFKITRSTKLPFKPGESLLVLVQSLIDKEIRRCIAKIAFNYLAFTQTEKYGLDQARNFLLQNAFTLIRDFIRNDRTAKFQLVIADPKPILRDDTLTARQIIGHIITVDWTSDSSNIVAQVSLFNRLRYRVSLTQNYSGIIRPIRSGNLFDIEKRTIRRLAGNHPIAINKL